MTIAARKPAEDSFIATPGQVGKIEDITPALPQPLSTSSAPSISGLPALPASSISFHHPRHASELLASSLYVHKVPQTPYDCTIENSPIQFVHH
jgi:hypothetical protein